MKNKMKQTPSKSVGSSSEKACIKKLYEKFKKDGILTEKLLNLVFKSQGV